MASRSERQSFRLYLISALRDLREIQDWRDRAGLLPGEVRRAVDDRRDVRQADALGFLWLLGGLLGEW